MKKERGKESVFNAVIFVNESVVYLPSQTLIIYANYRVYTVVSDYTLHSSVNIFCMISVKLNI